MAVNVDQCRCILCGPREPVQLYTSLRHAHLYCNSSPRSVEHRREQLIPLHTAFSSPFNTSCTCSRLEACSATHMLLRTRRPHLASVVRMQTFAPLPSSHVVGFECARVTLTGLRGTSKRRTYYLAECMGAQCVTHLLTRNADAGDVSVHMLVCPADARWLAAGEAARAWAGADADGQEQIVRGLVQQYDKLSAAVRCGSVQWGIALRARDADQT